MKNSPIGVFDSGFGGLTILKEILQVLPEHDFIYMGDNARAPYGDKDFEKVHEYTLQSVQWFFQQGCPLVILACNTASAKALRTIQQKDLPFIDSNKRVLGVIRPTSEVIGSFSQSKHIGVLGTTGTIQSQSYIIEIEKFSPDIIVSQEACPEWVSLIEKNEMETPDADYHVKKHIDQILTSDKQIDTLLLACTHYPLLMKKIKEHTPPGISIISQGGIVAKSLLNYLDRHPDIAENCTKNANYQFFTTGDPDDFNNHASMFFEKQIVAKKLILP